jgi:hypothetical protein
MPYALVSALGGTFLAIVIDAVTKRFREKGHDGTHRRDEESSHGAASIVDHRLLFHGTESGSSEEFVAQEDKLNIAWRVVLGTLGFAVLFSGIGALLWLLTSPELAMEFLLIRPGDSDEIGGFLAFDLIFVVPFGLICLVVVTTPKNRRRRIILNSIGLTIAVGNRAALVPWEKVVDLKIGKEFLFIKVPDIRGVDMRLFSMLTRSWEPNSPWLAVCNLELLKVGREVLFASIESHAGPIERSKK